MKRLKEAPGLFRWRGLLALSALIFIIYGCGPGFPIVTEEQQTLMDTVDRSAKDTALLEQRITALESRGADKEGVEALKLRLAETTKAVEDLGREFSFARGSMEEAGNAQAQASSEIAALEETVRGLSERIRSLEAAKAGTLAEVSRLKEALETSSKKTAALEGEVALLSENLQSQAYTSSPGTAPSAATGTRPGDRAGQPAAKAGQKKK
ncbi:MAG: hypothetical protein ACE5DR_06030, partial [Thermodesulfobacteriota bacterium]